MTLLDIPDNPMPPGGRVGTARTADGRELRHVFWPRPGSAPQNQGTVLLLQGRAEFIEKYFEIAGALLARGFSVLAFDWRGQGGSDRALSDRHLGHIGEFAEFRQDYEAMRGLVSPDEPLTVLAHSMGGAIALWGARDGWLAADRLVCINPMVGLSMVRAEPFAKALARLLRWLGFGRWIVPGGVHASISTQPFPGNLLSTDEGRYARNAALAGRLGWQAIGSPTIGWLAAAYDFMEELTTPGKAERIGLPVLMAVSEQDPVCSSPIMKDFAGRLPAGRMLLVPNARHEILMETDAILARFWSAFDAFVESTAPNSNRAATSAA